MPENEIDIVVQAMSDNPSHFRINVHAPLRNILPKIVNKVLENNRISAEDCKFLIARQLTSDEINLTENMEESGLILQNGDYIIIVPQMLSTGTSLEVYDARSQKLINTFDQDSVMIGRLDSASSIYPDLDITPLLTQGRDNKISRKQAYFLRKNHKWFVTLHKDARTNVYLNLQTLTRNQLYEIEDGASVSFGGSATSPEARIICKIINI